MKTIKFKISNLMFDEKIKAYSAYGLMKIGDYLSLVENNLLEDDLSLQRGRETRKREVYKRLREDLQKSTIIPVISLALHRINFPNIKEGDTIELIEGAVYILDGLQRTLALIEVKNDLKNNPTYLNREIRFEVWLNASIEALLYKMVVLNSGQTPMSIRHQIEILNKPFKEDFETLTNKKTVVYTWKNKNAKRQKPQQYNLSDLVEFFISFSTSKPYVDKNNLIVEQIEKIDFLNEYSGLKDKYGNDDILFNEFVNTITKFDDLLCKKYPGNKPYKSGDFLMRSNTFLSGFFAAFGKALNLGGDLFKEKRNLLFNIINSTNEDPMNLNELNDIMIDLRSKSKRFGDTERQFYFDAFKSFINNREQQKEFKEFWTEAIPNII